MFPRRSVLLLALVLTACSSAATASPSPSTARASARPSAVSFPSLSAGQRLNDHVGYVAGWTGSGLGLAKTSDDGASWKPLAVPTSRITALRFIDEQVGWVGGFEDRGIQVACQQAAPSGTPPCYGVVLRTQDGGHSWQTVLAIPTDDVQGDPIMGLQAVDGQIAWALTLDPSPCQPCLQNLQRTTDGGRTWTRLLHGPIALMRFATGSRGWIALYDPAGSETATVEVTSDGGATWQSRLRAIDGGPAALDAASANVAWFLTRNGGYCTASNCDRYGLYRTQDGGLSWTYLDNPKAFAVGCTGGHLAGPLFASVTTGWFGINLGAGGANVGPGGLMRSRDGGLSWHCATTPPNINLVTAADPLHLWAAGDDRSNNDQSSALYSSDDGGSTWHRLSFN